MIQLKFTPSSVYLSCFSGFAQYLPVSPLRYFQGKPQLEPGNKLTDLAVINKTPSY